MEPPRIAILNIGNELLRATVRDALGHEIAALAFEHAGEVVFWEIVPDDVPRIAEAVKRAIGMGVDLIVTTGGLGPTHDDVTLEGVARGTGRELGISEPARRHVAAFYERATRAEVLPDGALNKEREKMAHLPVGAEVLENPVGAAPGVLLRMPGTRIVSLPGVPREARGIIDTSMQSVFAEVFGKGRSASVAVSTPARDESALARALEPVSREFPHAAIKTRPRSYGRAVRIEVHISVRGRDLRDAKSKLQKVARRVILVSRTAGDEK
ncbi:MAG TPA: molybdopterin-binding protein [Thermoplasmata archaeon]|nr:molybdopterin-binding protein [Thermoplasmata archaeon]